MNGEGWGIEDADAIAAELDRALANRIETYPGLVAKNRLHQDEADYLLALLREIRTDLDVAFGPPPWLLPEAKFDWRTKVNWMKAELERLELAAPKRIAAGTLEPLEAERSLFAMRQLVRLFWEKGFGWVPPDGEDPIAATRALLAEIQAETAPAPALL